MNFIQPNWNAPSNIKAYTTLRHTWGDQNVNPKSHESNEKLKTLLHLPNTPAWIQQIHSNIVVAADTENVNQSADASYTNKSNQVCIVLTADCLPLLICNKQGTHIAAIHAGWRGLASGIIEATLDALKLPGEELLVWLGPAIGPQKFEVGHDVYTAFTNKHPESHQAFIPKSNEKWLANLYELAKIRLKQRGIAQIYGGDFCTYTQDDLFFSYRRDKGVTGRIASLIWMS